MKLEEGAAYFDGLTFRLDGPERMVVFLSMKHDGEITEERLDYRRTRPAGEAH